MRREALYLTLENGWYYFRHLRRSGFALGYSLARALAVCKR